jgi:MoaD family protein
MIVSVRFFNILAAYTGIKQSRVTLPDGATLRELVHQLAGDYSEAFRNILLPEGTLNPHLHFFRNGTRVGETELDSPLCDGDEIMLFPAVAGGSQATLHPSGGGGMEVE